MQEKQELLKELKRESFINKIKTEKEMLALTICGTLNLKMDYVEKHIVLDQQEEKPYDLITKITPNYIKIKTSKFNKKIKELPDEDRFYIKTYNEKTQQYKVKIDINKIFEQYYDEVLEEELNDLNKTFNVNNKKGALLDLAILSASLSLIPREKLVSDIEKIKEQGPVNKIRITIAY